jgi:hypothetical protein
LEDAAAEAAGGALQLLVLQITVGDGVSARARLHSATVPKLPYCAMLPLVNPGRHGFAVVVVHTMLYAVQMAAPLVGVAVTG